MERASLDPKVKQLVEIARGDRWQAYQRLQDLEIPCWCDKQGGLEVQVNSPLAAMQVWSVMQQFTQPRGELAAWLNGCWRQKG